MWLGTRTDAYDATLRFFTEVIGLPVQTEEADFAVLDVPDGSTVEIFGPHSADNQHLVHPVAGLQVDDLPAALAELEAAGAEIVLPIQHGGPRSWLHFRAPDGFVYELSADDAASP